MKKLFVVFVVIAIVSAVLFACSIAAYGVKDGNYGVSIGIAPFEIDSRTGFGFGFASGIRFIDGVSQTSYSLSSDKEYSYTFNETVENIDISALSGDTVVTCGNTDKVTVKYSAGNRAGKSLVAEVKDGCLTVKETGTFIFNLFNFGASETKIEVILPEKIYDSIYIRSTSGKVTVDKVISESFKSDITSGRGDYSIFAKEIDVYTTSGTVSITNCTKEKAERISVKSLSGSRSISGFEAEEFIFDSTSGELTAEGISGKVSVDSTSGNVWLSYAVWDGDLDIDMTSGNTEVILPEGSGIDIDLDCASGSVKSDLDGQAVILGNGVLGENSRLTTGGDNVHRVRVDLTSGNVNIHN
ncbi:MAG: DUF4097 family beta strand repeat-containing protein [Ruminiclostridium sp.]